MVRWNGLSQRKWKPSASRARIGARSRSRSSWNGVRVASSASVASTYDTVWATNGSARPTVKSAPPIGGAARLTTASRPVTTATAAGNCAFGTTERSAPACATEKKAAPLPSTNAISGIIQNTIRSVATSTARVPIVTRTQRVGADHQPPAAPVVGQQPGGQREDRHREQACERDEPGFGGRVGQRKHEQRIGDRRHLRPAAREQLRRLQQHEVAVLAQRRRGHTTTLTEATAAPRAGKRAAGAELAPTRTPRLRRNAALVVRS